MDIVRLQDYAQGGAGSGSAQDVMLLQKAMNAGELTGRETAGVLNTGESLKVESLENTLRTLTFSEADIKLWKRVPKLPAYNTVEEYNMLVEYGQEGNSFTNEGELGEESDAQYLRSAQHVKYLNRVKQVSHPMQLVNVMGGDVMQNKIKEGTIEVLRDANTAMAYGDSNLVKQQFNGFYQQHRASFATLDQWYNSEVVIDCRGKALSEENIQQAQLALVENNAVGSLFMAPPQVLTSFASRFHEYKMIQPGTTALTDGTMGQKVSQFQSQFGPVALDFDKFLKVSKPKTVASLANNQKSPAAPLADVTTPVALVADSTNKFFGQTGDYIYAVSAINRYGESALTVLGAGKVTTTAGSSVSLKFSAGTGGSFAPTAYNIYRTELNPLGTAATAKFYKIMAVSVSELANGYDVVGTTSGAGTVLDKNRFIANTESAFLTDPTLDVWSFKQLAPLMKLDLAILGPSNRFCVLLYGTPILYAPKKMVRFINIGTDLNPIV